MCVDFFFLFLGGDLHFFVKTSDIFMKLIVILGSTIALQFLGNFNHTSAFSIINFTVHVAFAYFMTCLLNLYIRLLFCFNSIYIFIKLL